MVQKQRIKENIIQQNLTQLMCLVLFDIICQSYIHLFEGFGNDY